MMGQDGRCSACAGPLVEGQCLESFGAWFCSACFIGNAARFYRELQPEELAALRALGQHLGGFLPPELVEMLATGFLRRMGRPEPVPAPELARFVGEIQRLFAFYSSFKILSLLRTLKDEVGRFVDGQEEEIRDAIRRLGDLE